MEIEDEVGKVDGAKSGWRLDQGGEFESLRLVRSETSDSLKGETGIFGLILEPHCCS